MVGAERVLLTPDCGFATLAYNPLNSDVTAEARMAALANATRIRRERHHIAWRFAFTINSRDAVA